MSNHRLTKGQKRKRSPSIEPEIKRQPKNPGAVLPKRKRTNLVSLSTDAPPTQSELEERQREALDNKASQLSSRSPPGALAYESATHDIQNADELTDDDPLQDLNPFFSKTPFRGLVVGPMKSGKTSLLRHLIENVFEGIYDEVHVWNPNVLNDPGYHWLWTKNSKGDRFPVERIHLKWQNNEIDDLIRGVQRERTLQSLEGVPVNSQYRALWIIDDATSMEGSPMSKGDHSIVNTRFNGINVILSTHRMTLVSPLTRAQMEFVIYYPGGSAKDDQLFYDEMGALDGLEPVTVKHALMRIAATTKPYNYVAFNNLEPQGRKLRHGIGGPHILDTY